MIAVQVSEAEPKPEMTRLGSYTIVRKLAKGGMAEIYLARSTGPEGFEKLVVLKRILPKYAENPRFVQLFLDEAKLAASLDHPHIVHVYDMGRADGHYFFTMEYVHGQDVRSILRKASRGKQPLPIAIAVHIARTMAAALHHAHERKRPDGISRDIVHRDVSPSNILVSYDGAIKLADFGVAKAASSSVRTRTGALKGKVGYMSPEQARGMTIDRRSDIFALGVVLWELVSMRRLFKSDNDLATIQAIINTAPPPLADFRPDCPAELDRIARKALEKDPLTRYQTAQHLQRDLDELARELKLDQSSIALSHFMTELFDTEIAAWREAQSTGVTVTDFVVAHSSPHSVTPVSESDFSLDDPGDDEEDDDGPEVDEEQSEPTALPPRSPVELAPRAGSISRDEPEVEDATDFGPPPTMDRSLAATVSRVKPPVIPARVPATRDTEREDNPFDNATTRLRPNPLTSDGAFNEQPTSVAAPAFTEEAPTVQAPPDVLKRAFAETAETVQAAPAYKDILDAAYPTPPPGTHENLFGKGELPTTPYAKPTPKTGGDTTPFGKVPDTSPYPMQSPSVHVTPQTPAVGVPSMPHGKVGSSTERVTPLPPPAASPVVPLPPAAGRPPAMLGDAPPDTMPGVAMPAMQGAMPPGMQGAMPPMQGAMPVGMPASTHGGMSGGSLPGSPGAAMPAGSMPPGGLVHGGPGPMHGGGGGPMHGGGGGPMHGGPGGPIHGGHPGAYPGSAMPMPGSPTAYPAQGMPMPGSPTAYPAQGMPMPGHPMQSPYPVRPQTPPVGVPSMYPYLHDLDPNLDIDLAPGRRRWFIIAGVAVGLAVIAIILVLLLSSGPAEEAPEEEPTPEPAPKSEAAPQPAPAGSDASKVDAKAKPAAKVDPKAGSAVDQKAAKTEPTAKAGSAEGSATGAVEPKTEAAAVEPTKALPKITKQPPLKRPTRRR